MFVVAQCYCERVEQALERWLLIFGRYPFSGVRGLLRIGSSIHQSRSILIITLITSRGTGRPSGELCRCAAAWRETPLFLLFTFDQIVNKPSLSLRIKPEGEELLSL